MTNKKTTNKKEVYIDNLDYDDENEDFSKTWNDVYYRNTIDELSNIYNSLKDEQSVQEPDIHNSESLDEATERLKLDGEAIHSFTENVKSDIALKNKYASKFLWIFIIQMAVFYGVFIAVGLGILKFDELTLRLFVSGGFIESIAIIKIIVQYLFQDNFSKSLSDILEKNKKNK